VFPAFILDVAQISVVMEIVRMENLSGGSVFSRPKNPGIVFTRVTRQNESGRNTFSPRAA
jgi:hypothetical protein